MNYFKETCSRLINALLPQSCALCQQATGGNSPLCDRCLPDLPLLPSQHCPQCADFSAASAICGRCLKTAPAFDQVFSPFLYAEPVDQLIQALKYQHHLHLAAWFGNRLATTLERSTAELDRIDAVLPLPLHPARLRSRGFNQALEIARPVARRLGKPLLPSAALRSRDTAPQASLPRDDRQANIRGAFECQSELPGQTVLLIDDVLTTGSSADELARVLKIHGAARVIVGVVARTHHANLGVQ